MLTLYKKWGILMKRFLIQFFHINHVKMSGRDHTEAHRAATMLELMYDLVSVIAIASAAAGLHHSIIENHIGHGIISYAMAFFAIWWAWMSFTWFASSFDTDDLIYRSLVFIKMAGALILAAGIETASKNLDYTIALVGYIIMRVALISLWLRVALHSKENRASALGNILGISLCQLGWFFLIMYAPKEYFMYVFVFLVFCELSVPYLTEKTTRARFHLHHIVERYGLLTIIVLGECFLGLVSGIKLLFADFTSKLFLNVFSGLIITLMMWWLYFEKTNCEIMSRKHGSFVWGYIHIVIFASVAAVGVGIAVMNDYITGYEGLTAQIARASISVPITLFVCSIWMIYDRLNSSLSIVQKFLLPLVGCVSLALIFVDNGINYLALVLFLTVIVRHYED